MTLPIPSSRQAQIELYKGATDDPHAPIRAAEVIVRFPRDAAILGAEIGVFRGEMSNAMLKMNKNLRLLMIDAWEGNGAAYIQRADPLSQVGDDVHRLFLKEAETDTHWAMDRRAIIKARSLSYAPFIADCSLDFAFIDADHCHKACSMDIEAWWPKIRAGGYLCGHDYSCPVWGVTKAVDEFIARVKLPLDLGDDMTWFVQK